MKRCTIADCGARMLARGFCQKHYSRWARNGTAELNPDQAFREYPSEIVQRVRVLYESGLTIAEVAQEIGPGYKVLRIMQRYGIPRRTRAVRDQWGPNHPRWMGSAASYKALHDRVTRRRGKPSACEWCGISGPDGRYEWSNVSGDYENPDDFVRLCVKCHRNYDAARRKETGRNTVVGTKYYPYPTTA